MAASKEKTAEEVSLMDEDVEGIQEEDETECADDLWAYIEAHKDEVEDFEEYARRRGLL